MEGWQVYILECGDGSFYTGTTNNILDRMYNHARGTGSKYVKARKAKRLIAISCLMDKKTAMRLEWSIKNMCKTKDAKVSKIINSWILFYRDHEKLLGSK